MGVIDCDGLSRLFLSFLLGFPCVPGRLKHWGSEFVLVVARFYGL